MIDNLLSSLEEYLTLKRDISSGCADGSILPEVKKRFIKSLSELIDYQVSMAMDRKREKSSLAKLQIAETLQTQIKDTVSSLRSIAALNNAPPILSDVEAKDPAKVQAWFEAYRQWHEIERSKGMIIG